MPSSIGITGESSAVALKKLFDVLQDTQYGKTEGLRELYEILLDDGVVETIDASKVVIDGRMGCLMCADPERQGHMHQEVHSFFPNAPESHTCAKRVAPIKVFGGPLLLVNGVHASASVPLSPDAATDSMGQILIGQEIGNIRSYALMFHFPCGFACRAGKTRRDVLSSYPKAKQLIRATWRQAGIPQLKNIVGLFHFDFGDGEMATVRAAKGSLEKWLKNNKDAYTELLDVL
jgi:hypothetical protein